MLLTKSSQKLKLSTVLRSKFSLGVLVAAALLIATAAWYFAKEKAQPPLPQTLLVTSLANVVFDVAASEKPVLVAFWATTCAVCLQEMPQLIQFQKDHLASGLKVVAVAMPYDKPQAVLEFAKKREFALHYAIDLDGKINRAFGGVQETPIALVVYKQRIVKTIRGEPDWAKLHDFIKNLS
jgi:thiol-disulfide isomerase/thioredoxin